MEDASLGISGCPHRQPISGHHVAAVEGVSRRARGLRRRSHRCGLRSPRPSGSGPALAPSARVRLPDPEAPREPPPGASRGWEGPSASRGRRSPRPGVVQGGLPRAARAACVRTRSTRSGRGACRCPTLVAHTRCSRARRRRGSSGSCHKPGEDGRCQASGSRPRLPQRTSPRSGCTERVDRRRLDEARDRPRQLVVGSDEEVRL
jgi:hypothetical protein